jgi:uncharacterized protein (TIGR00106 family)
MKKWNGRVIADICVTPLGIPTPSVSSIVADVERILRRYPLQARLHSYGTNIEGDWETVSKAIAEIHESVHGSGVERISCNMRWGSRTDKEQTGLDKIEIIEKILL